MSVPCYVVTHPEVVVDPTIPVTQWRLNAAGLARAARLSSLPWAASVERIVCSTERKAVETAAALGGDLGLEWVSDPELGEIDRSSTGFLPAAEHEATADAVFARPGERVRGWESAEEAQRRIVRAVLRWTAVADVPTAYVCHGAVGTLLWCALSGNPIDRRHDQPGQGSWYAFDPWAWTASEPWQRIG